MAKRNREKLMEKSFYDLLCDLNSNIRKPSAGVCVCIYNGFGHDMQERRDRCMKYAGSCGKCIADYLNEYPF